MYVRGVRSEMIHGLAIFRRLPEMLDKKTLGKRVSTFLSLSLFQHIYRP